MEPLISEKALTILIALGAFTSFWAGWVALTWRPPLQARLQALATRRMKTRTEATPQKGPRTVASLGLLRKLADRLNLLRGSAADQTTRKLRHAGFMSRDAAVVYVFVKLALPLGLGFLMVVLTSV